MKIVYASGLLFFAFIGSGCSTNQPNQAYQAQRFPCGVMSNPMDFQECVSENYNPYRSE